MKFLYNYPNTAYLIIFLNKNSYIQNKYLNWTLKEFFYCGPKEAE